MRCAATRRLTPSSGWATVWPSPSSGLVNVVIKLRILEHIAGHEAFLAEIRRVLRPRGRPRAVVARSRGVQASPERRPTRTTSRRLDKQEFAALLAKFFPHVRLFGQASWIGSLILPDAQTSPEACGQPEIFRRRPDDTVAPTTGFRDATYLIAVASDSPVPAVAAGGFEDRPFLLRLYAEHQHRHEEILQREADIKTLLRQAEARDADAAARQPAAAGALGARRTRRPVHPRCRAGRRAGTSRRGHRPPRSRPARPRDRCRPPACGDDSPPRARRSARIGSPQPREETTSLRTELRGLRNELHARNQTMLRWRLVVVEADGAGTLSLPSGAVGPCCILGVGLADIPSRRPPARRPRAPHAKAAATRQKRTVRRSLLPFAFAGRGGQRRQSRAPLPPKAPAQDIQRPAVVNAVPSPGPPALRLTRRPGGDPPGIGRQHARSAAYNRPRGRSPVL